MDKGRAADRFIEFLDIYVSRDEGTLSRMGSMFGDEFTGFGTALHEVFKSREEIIKQLEKEITQTPKGAEYQILWIDEHKLTDDISAVNCRIGIKFQMEGKTVELSPIRMSAVMQFKEDDYYIVNWHLSFPDYSRSDEFFPGSADPKRYDEISVIFTDFVGFTNAASTISAVKLVSELNELFVKFDEIAAKHGVDKIKTIGDSYMAVAGLDEKDENHAVQCVEWAREAIAFLRERNQRSGIKWDMRVGIHSGDAVGGVIGKDKLSFDLWGDTINITAHLEKNSTANEITVSAHTYDLIKNNFECEYRGKIDVKGKGSIDMYFVRQ